MMGPNPQYSKLKTKILEAAGSNFSLEEIKEHFAVVINSKRALGRVNNLSSFIYLLEERDLVNSGKISIFKKIAELLENDTIKELIHVYKKLYLDGLEENICMCGAPTTFQPERVPMFQQPENQRVSQNNNLRSSNVNHAIINVSKYIGKSWTVLARALDLEEGFIEQIRAKYAKDYEGQAQAALNLWQKRHQENATIELLDKALNHRNCKRFGLGSYLLKPRIET